MTDPSSQALLGAEARLRCHFDIGGLVALRSLRVTWKLWDDKIAQYDEGRTSAQPGARLVETELEKGDASLALDRVMVTDEGLYTCAVGYGAQQQQGSTSLRVLGEGRRGALHAPRCL
ncbi:tapasin-related protein-like [Alligator mississippiensis]|uniref:Tapasin-related protein-like n=1 Tax=Alligator mississippiensis TaxID=8496 RepID=A0A151MS01_ALLMI|nr:tapasin-related protein-like [Alligator mississippiensis]